MTQQTWTAVDEYFNAALLPADPVLEAARARSEAEGLPDIAVAPTHGRLLNLIARIHGARRILEVGTLGGYSTIWLARALPPDGLLVTLELDPHHAEVARANLKAAGVDERAQVRVGRAADSLAALAEQRPEPFDMVFIDADKPSNALYLEWALRLSRPGTVIVVDNVVRDGRVVEADSPDPAVQGVRQLLDMIAAEPRLTATAIQTTGVKGYDGFLLALVES
ncbi:O-methyltransferase [Actinocrinis puniceicyclus]|uniref:O-methyltransferase n=1 Tax=Actinocrinis puniceicyclus TaxID=977794 RepID=A0A8J7WS47_9ACTN|nr:O-methyltransferase [Actinocrinis puniceicyclus]MBS2965705.1 O-methyltransferase [Actinocrinis puniceicyclus]